MKLPVLRLVRKAGVIQESVLGPNFYHIYIRHQLNIIHTNVLFIKVEINFRLGTKTTKNLLKFRLRLR